MTLKARKFRSLAAGLLGGFVAWLVVEKSGWFFALLYGDAGPVFGSKLYKLQAISGGLYGLTISALLALALWSKLRPGPEQIRRLVAAAIAGFISGAVCIQIGQAAYTRIDSPQIAATGSPELQLLMGALARAASWGIVGLGVGAAQGVTRGSTRAARLGAIGGLAGGFTGGIFLEAIEDVTANPPLARAVCFVFVGGVIGLFIELVPALVKQALLRIESGRGQGKEYPLEKSWTSIGRSELADISLFGDPSIAPIHCHVQISPTLYKLRPVLDKKGSAVSKTYSPIRIHGKTVTSDTALIGGEQIEIGDRTLSFTLRKTDKAPAIKHVPEPIAPLSSNAGSPKIPSAAYTSEAQPLQASEVGAVAQTALRNAPDGLTGSKLVCTAGPYCDQTFPLTTRAATVIGRAREQDIPLTSDKSVSRRHAVIRLIEGRHRIEDLKSANGTYINDAFLPPNDPKILKPGDIIRIGDTVLQYS